MYGSQQYAPQQYAQQPYPPQQQYGGQPQSYGHPQQYAQAQPYGHPQSYGQEPQQPPHARVPRPKEASGFRRYPAIILDWLLAVVLGVIAAKAVGGPKSDHPGSYFMALLAVGFGVSYVNQVLFARLTGFSVGKGLMALRVIRKKDGSRPHTWRLTKRWAIGFVIIAVSLITEDFEDGEVFGVRVVRRKHLSDYQQAAARLG
ncbi:RDD family protein [Kitasatospora hibisci]|uniref:RDD family protein n=1 Tax=Kitasatospora hibisci TaxID=3369522 RepID=UPI003754F192